MFRLRVPLWYAALGLLLPWGWILEARAEVLDRIVAIVDGEPVTLYDVRAFQKQKVGQGLLPTPGQGSEASDRELLDALLMEKLVDKEVEAQGIAAREQDIDSYIQRVLDQNRLTEEDLRQALEMQGMAWDEYRRQIAKEIERAMLISREIGSRVNVTPEDVERYYQEHLSEYQVPERIRVRHIFLPFPPLATEAEMEEVQKQIEEIYRRALAGEDFATLAQAYSQGPGAEEGGDLGYFAKGSMNPEIEKVAFSLKPGEVSQPFSTDVGWHLIRVEEYQAEGHRPLAEVEEEIKNKLYEEALQKRYRRWFEEDLRSRHHIELVASLDGKKVESFLVPAEPEVPKPTREKKKPSLLRRLIPFF